MSTTPRTTEQLGFLTIIDHPKLGVIGGYLVVNSAGRPLEFSCTTPVKPNRAQEILYGNTLKPFLYGEQIAKTLVSRSKNPVAFLLTDEPAVLAVEEFVEQPILYVFPSRQRTTAEKTENGEPPLEITEELGESLKEFGIENSRLQCVSDDSAATLRIPMVPGLELDHWRETRIGKRTIAFPMTDEAEWNRMIEEIKYVARIVDLEEPFDRLRMAIEEAA